MKTKLETENAIKKMQLELEIIKKALNWREELTRHAWDTKGPRIEITICDEGVRSVVRTSGEYEEVIFELTPDQVKILKEVE